MTYLRMTTKSQTGSVHAWSCCCVAVLVVLGGGCRKSATESPSAAPVTKPAEAATQLQQAFVSAPAEVKQTATAASEALRAADYEAAMRSLQAMKARQDLTPQQSMAVHESSAALEARLIAAMERGDPNAKRAYEQLRRSRRR
jgi:hypothetical protein